MPTINCPGVCSKRYATGTVVNLTATPDGADIFVGWSGDVPGGHEQDNPVAITMTTDKTLTATFNHNSALLLSLKGNMFLGSASGFVVATGNFFRIGDWSGNGDGPGTPVGHHQARLPISMTAERMFMRLYTTNTTAKFGSIRFNINGVGNNTLLCTFGLPDAPTRALAGAGAGNVTNGTHSWKITFVINGVENFPSAASSSLNVTNNAVDGKVQLSVITLGPTGTSARKIYRTVSGDTGDYLLVGTINDNTTTTFLDNVADGSLGAAAPAVWIAGSAEGTLSMAQDDLICFEGVTFDGANHANIACLTTGYAAAQADGYIHPAKNYSTISTNATYGYIGWANANTNDRRGLLPKQLTVNEGTMVADAAAGATHSFAIQLTLNDGAGTVGSAMTLADPATSTRSTMNAVLPLTTTGAQADGNNLKATDDSGAAATTNIRPMFSYQVDSPDEFVSFYSQASGSQAFTVSSTPVYSQLNYVQISTSTPVGTTEAANQIVMPTGGTFKYMGVKCNAISAGKTFQVTFRVNGVDSALTVACNDSGQWFSDLAHTVTVVAGDLVNFEFHRTDGGSGGLTFTPQIVIGFTTAE